MWEPWSPGFCFSQLPRLQREKETPPGPGPKEGVPGQAPTPPAGRAQAAVKKGRQADTGAVTIFTWSRQLPILAVVENLASLHSLPIRPLLSPLGTRVHPGPVCSLTRSFTAAKIRKVLLEGQEVRELVLGCSLIGITRWQLEHEASSRLWEPHTAQPDLICPRSGHGAVKKAQLRTPQTCLSPSGNGSNIHSVAEDKPLSVAPASFLPAPNFTFSASRSPVYSEPRLCQARLPTLAPNVEGCQPLRLCRVPVFSAAHPAVRLLRSDVISESSPSLTF